MQKDWTGNATSVYNTLGASNHTDQEREERDYYATDPKAIDYLLKVETPTSPIWECACGEGNLSQRLKDKGFEVYSSDIVERNYPLDNQLDFLSVLNFNEEYDVDILTNPPYKYAKEFVLKALDLVKPGRKVFMFLKVLFLEGEARYKEIFSKYPPKHIYVFSKRIQCSKNNREFDSGGAVAYAWFVWEKGYQGETIVSWV